MFDRDSKSVGPSVGGTLEQIHNYHIDMLFYGSGITRVGGGSGNDRLRPENPASVASVGCVLARTTLNTPHPAQNGA